MDRVIILIIVIICTSTSFIFSQEPSTRPKPKRLAPSDKAGSFIVSDSQLNGQWDSTIVWDGTNLLLNGDTVLVSPAPIDLRIDTFQMIGDSLYLSFEDDDLPAWIADLSMISGSPGGGSDDQNLVYNGNGLLSIERGNSVDLSDLLDNTDSQTLSLAANLLSISGGNSVDLSLYLDNTDSQTLNLLGNSLLISSGNSVDLSSFLDNTDNQILSYTGNGILNLSNSGSVDLSDLYQTIDQFNISGANLLQISISQDQVSPLAVDLSPYLDNTDNQIIDELDYNEATGVLSLSIQGDGQSPVTTQIPRSTWLADTLPNGSVGVNAGNNNFTIGSLELLNFASNFGASIRMNNEGIRFVTRFDRYIEISSGGFTSITDTSIIVVDPINNYLHPISISRLSGGQSTWLADTLPLGEVRIFQANTLQLELNNNSVSDTLLILSCETCDETRLNKYLHFDSGDDQIGFQSLDGNITLYSNTGGLKYAGDYSNDFNNRSLVDKEYVDGLTGGFPSTWLADSLPNGNIDILANQNRLIIADLSSLQLRTSDANINLLSNNFQVSADFISLTDTIIQNKDVTKDYHPVMRGGSGLIKDYYDVYCNQNIPLVGFTGALSSNQKSSYFFVVPQAMDGHCISSTTYALESKTSNASAGIVVNNASAGVVLIDTSGTTQNLNVVLNEGDKIYLETGTISGSSSSLMATIETSCDCSN